MSDATIQHLEMEGYCPFPGSVKATVTPMCCREGKVKKPGGILYPQRITLCRHNGNTLYLHYIPTPICPGQVKLKPGHSQEIDSSEARQPKIRSIVIMGWGNTLKEDSAAKEQAQITPNSINYSVSNT